MFTAQGWAFWAKAMTLSALLVVVIAAIAYAYSAHSSSALQLQDGTGLSGFFRLVSLRGRPTRLNAH